MMLIPAACKAWASLRLRSLLLVVTATGELQPLLPASMGQGGRRNNRRRSRPGWGMLAGVSASSMRLRTCVAGVDDLHAPNVLRGPEVGVDDNLCGTRRGYRPVVVGHVLGDLQRYRATTLEVAG